MGGRSGQSVRRRRTININEAMEKINNLPKGKIFDDAKNIESIFKRSSKSYSEVLETFEKNRDKGKLTAIDIKDISVTQPNIQSNKVNAMIKNIKKTPTINVVQFKDGTRAIFDGHHRLVTNWAVGNTKIKVNLVKE